MFKNITITLLILVSLNSVAGVTLQCNVDTKCDAYVSSCNYSPYSFSIFVEQDDSSVTFGNTKLEADFSNPAEVSFNHIGYTFYINKYEYSATLANKTEVRSGFCNKVEAAW